jgi:hypothetical protein
MRICAAFLMIFGGLAQLASAATISAIIRPNLGPTPSPGEAFKNGTSQGFFGIFDAGIVPDNNIPYIFLDGTGANSFTYSGGEKAVVETYGRRNMLSFYSTTYAYYEGFLSASTPGETYNVVNGGYWEFTVDGNFDFAIDARAPVISGNVRTYRFEKVGGSELVSDLVGTSATTRTGTIGTGIYRLYFDHSNSTPGVNGPSGPPANLNGGTNLDIEFTQSSGGAVPEPTSVAVFGLLSIGGALAKWRRKK